MNDDELKKLWQQQPLRKPDVSPEQLISAMQKQARQLRGILDARDLREMAACALVMIIFGIFYFTAYRTPVSRVGDLIVIGSSIFVASRLVYTRRKTPPAPPGATVVESLHAELNAVRAQSRLLGSILWWYLLPLGVGILVCTWGNAREGLADNIGNIVYTIFVIALGASIYRLNQLARRKQLLPLESQLESLIRSAETGEPPDESSVIGLRPIVLSMAAADRVKPAEFKVAFGQIALYGVTGVVGIWFFLMLGLTMDNKNWQTSGQAVETSTPIVRTDETNRYSVVAQKVVDLFNAGDYAALQKLYNPEMSSEFPPKETSDFYIRLAASFGNVEKFDGPTGDGYRGWTAFRLHCQHGELTMSLALDADDKISGIYFQPASMQLADFKNYATAKNLKSFILRLFSWQHLVWLPAFFLAGLLYSWLLHRGTSRAVGISTLGVHLYKGQNLVLWDEIKEVRPLRILNIRSLWLISESGEKTIMPWTSLERHSDLKAAVAGFAPANHPIHKYLSLLKRRGAS